MPPRIIPIIKKIGFKSFFENFNLTFVNEKIKFKDLYNTAKELGASCLITGHYVSSKVLNGKRALFRAKDNSKDQSYFLFTTTHEQLDYIRFPLVDLNKSETRDIAKDLGLLVADKPDSQDICFVADGHY